MTIDLRGCALAALCRQLCEPTESARLSAFLRARDTQDVLVQASGFQVRFCLENGLPVIDAASKSILDILSPDQIWQLANSIRALLGELPLPRDLKRWRNR